MPGSTTITTSPAVLRVTVLPTRSRPAASRAHPGRGVDGPDLFRAHALELVRLAVVMVGDLATAEDVVQDAFERLHRGWRGLRQPSSGLAYVRSSVLNGCRSVHRRAAVARKHVPRLAEPPGASGEDAASAADDRGEMAAPLRLPPRPPP